MSYNSAHSYFSTSLFSSCVTGHIYERKMGIPVFVDIQLAQSTGLVDQRNDRVYHQVLDNLRTEALSFETKEKLGNPGRYWSFYNTLEIIVKHFVVKEVPVYVL